MLDVGAEFRSSAEVYQSVHLCLLNYIEHW